MTLTSGLTLMEVLLLGIVLFISVVITATFGFLVMRGEKNIPFNWHLNMARLTIGIAIIHGAVALAYYFGI